MKLKIKEIKTLIRKSFELVRLYHDKVEIPSALKGTLGELIVYKKLLQKFPAKKKDIDYKGGTQPYDIAIWGRK